jgi:AAA ATPase-like protein
MDPVTNPYRPGAGTDPPALLGRDELIDRFGVTIRRALARRPGKSLMPIGLRGVGKTVLLNRFCAIAEHAGIKFAFIESPEDSDLRTLLALNLHRVLREFEQMGIRGAAKGALKKALGVLKSFSVQLPDGSKVAIDVDPLVGIGDSGVLADDVTALLIAIGEAAVERGSGLLVAIDEVQYLSGPALGALVSAIHRTTQLNLPVVLVGAGLPQLPGLAGQAKSYSERLFDFPMIGSLDTNDAEAAIRIPAQQNGVEFAGEAITAIVSEAKGYPYFLQEWGSHVWNLADGSPITKEHVSLARPVVIDQLDRNFFLVRFDRLTRMERVYLRAMAELGAGPHRSGDIAKCLGARVESVAPRRSELISKGMIYSPAHGDTAFTVPLFDEYLKRAMPKWQPPKAKARKSKSKARRQRQKNKPGRS